jgi:hypothetical protein
VSAAYILPGLRIRIHTLHGATAPRPLPCESGFTEGQEYPVLGAVEHDSGGELWLILPNNRLELWRISNRHCRYVSPSNERPSFIDPVLWAQMQDQGT